MLNGTAGRRGGEAVLKGGAAAGGGTGCQAAACALQVLRDHESLGSPLLLLTPPPPPPCPHPRIPGIRERGDNSKPICLL